MTSQVLIAAILTSVALSHGSSPAAASGEAAAERARTAAVRDTTRAPAARPDTLAPEVRPPDWSARRIKDLIESQTGPPPIEGTEWRKRKNPRTAMLCALTVPGLGQIYNEKPLKAMIAMGVETFYMLQVLHNYRKEKEELDLRDSYDKYVQCGPEGRDLCLNPDWRFHNAWMEEYKARKVDWIWWTSGAVLVIMLDAYVDAHLHDMRFRLEGASLEGGAGLAVTVAF